jgi:hypothetical protein
MGCSVLNRKLIYLGCNQKSWSSSNAVQYCWNNLKGKNAPITQIKKKKKTTTNIYRLLTKLEAATSYISY